MEVKRAEVMNGITSHSILVLSVVCLQFGVLYMKYHFVKMFESYRTERNRMWIMPILGEVLHCCIVLDSTGSSKRSFLTRIVYIYQWRQMSDCWITVEPLGYRTYRYWFKHTNVCDTTPLLCYADIPYLPDGRELRGRKFVTHLFEIDTDSVFWTFIL